MELVFGKIKEFLKENPVTQAMFNHYNVPIEEIDDVEMYFDDLPASAKTKNGIIYINSSFLDDNKFSDDIHYVVHELCHYLQQTQGDPYDLISDTLDYLEIPAELEAFLYQVAFMRDFYGDEVADNYIEELLDFHEYEGEERERKLQLFEGV